MLKHRTKVTGTYNDAGEKSGERSAFEMIVWTITLTLLLRNSFCLKLRDTAVNVLYFPVLTGVLPVYLATGITWEENNGRAHSPHLTSCYPESYCETTKFLFGKTLPQHSRAMCSLSVAVLIAVSLSVDDLWISHDMVLQQA